MTPYSILYRSCALLICISLCLSVAEFPSDRLNGFHSKFEFQHSFKPPLLLNSKGQIPFWEHGGDALPTDDQIRVCPSIQERSGWVWNKHRLTSSDWMFDSSLSISGRNTYGADGMAFWFTSEKGSSGNMFGSGESFNGLGVIIDTFDNNGQGDTPKISVFVSNGTLVYNHGTDGANQDSGFCLKEVRNKRFPVQIKVVYYRKTLEVWINDGNTNSTDAHDLCIKIDGVYLPGSGYFGISAATGGLSDDHDVMSFLVHRLTQNEELRGKLMENLDKAHAEQLQEYQKFSENFETKQIKPAQEKKQDWEVRLELEDNVRLVYDMQSSLVRDIRMLSSKVDNIRSTGGGGGGGISDDKVNAMEGRLSHHLQELKTHITSSGGKLTASEQLQPIYEIKESMKHLKETIDQLNKNFEEIRSNRCPQSVSCLSTGFFILIVIVQSTVVIAFLFVKYTQERNAKKFF